jgi:hypothetical protein
MSTLKKFHDFMMLLRLHMQIPPPKMSVGQYIQENIRPPENQDTPMTFNIDARRDGISFFCHIEISNKGMFSGLISSLELKADGIALTIYHSRTDFTDLGDIPFSDIIAFHETKPSEAALTLFAVANEEKTEITNRQPEGGNRAYRHFTKPDESQPSIHL